MRLLIDTNILLDVLQNRAPHVKKSALIWKLCEAGLVTGYVPSFSFTNLVYIIRKELDVQKIEELYKKLKLIFSFTDLLATDVDKAVTLHYADFEDALHVVIAKRLKADAIISRNTKDFINDEIPALTPDEFLRDFTAPGDDRP